MKPTRRRDELTAEVLQARGGCPPADDLLKLLDGGVAPERQATWRAHVSACSACGTALRALEAEAVPTTAPPAILPADVAARSDALIAASQSEASRGEAATVRGGSRRYLLRAAAGVLVGALTITGYIWLRPTSPPAILEDVDLGPPRAAGELELLAPIGEQSAPPVSMRWRPDAEAASYRVLVFDERLDAIAAWDVPGGGAELILTEAQRALLIPGARYAWQVEARGPLGQALGRSEAVSFRIAAAPPGR